MYKYILKIRIRYSVHKLESSILEDTVYKTGIGFVAFATQPEKCGQVEGTCLKKYDEVH